MRTSFSDYFVSPLVWVQVIILALLLTLLALVITPLGPLLGAWAGNTFVQGLTVEGVSGSLLTSLKVEKLEWADGDITIVQGIELELGGPDFGENLAVINNLTVDSIKIELDESAMPRKRGELVDIGDFGTSPVNVLISSGSLRSFSVKEGGEALFQLKDLNLSGVRAQDNQLLLKNTKASMELPGQPSISMTVNALSMDMLEPHEFELNADHVWEHPELGITTINTVGFGFLQKYELVATGDITHPELGKQGLSLVAKGDFDFLDIARLSLTGENGEMQANGELIWTPNISTNLYINAEKLNTAQFSPEWPAEITGEFQLKGNLDKALRGELDIISLSGNLRGYPISGSGKVSMLNEELVFTKLQLQSAENTIKVNGRGSEPFDLSWDVNGGDISTLASGLTGRIKAQGTLTGSLETPVLNGSMNMTRLSFQGNKADSADVEIQTNDGELQLSGKAKGVLVSGERLRDISLRGQGGIKEHNITVSANHSKVKVAAALVGEWDAGVWRSKIDKISIENATSGRWSLVKPTKVVVSASEVAADELCMASNAGSVCMTANYSTQTGLKSSGKLKNAPLDILTPFLPAGLAVKGKAAGDYKVSVNPDLKGRVDLALSSGKIELKQGGKIQRFAYRKGVVKADLDGNDIKANINFDLPASGLVVADADIQLSPIDGKHKINSKGQFQKVPLGLVQTFLPDGMNLTGQASGQFDLEQTADGRKGELSLSSDDVRFLHNDPVAGRQRYRFDKVQVDASIDDDKVVATANLNIRGGGSFSTQANADLSQPDLIKSIEAKGQLSDMPMALAKAYLPKNLGINGLLSGSYNIRQQAGEPVGQVDLVASNGFFDYQVDQAKRQRYRYNSAKIKGTMQGKNVVADVDLALKDGGVLSTRANIDLANDSLINSIQAEGQVKDLPLALARPYLPKGLDFDGQISGQYQIRQEGNGPVGKVELLAQNGFFSYINAGSRERYKYRKAKLEGSLKGDQVLADAALELSDGGVVTSKVSAVISSLDKKPVFTAEGTLESIPLELAKAYLPKGLEIKGRVSGRYQLDQSDQLRGKVKLSVPDSSIRYDDGKMGVQQYDLTRADISADIRGNKVDADLDFVLRDGGAFSTKGRLDLAQPNNLFGFTGEGTLRAFPLALIQPYIPAKVALTGVVDGRYQLTQVGGQQGSIQLQLPANKVSFIDENGEPQHFEYASGELNATIRGKSIVGDALVVMKDGGTATAIGKITLGSSIKTHVIDIKGDLKAIPLELLRPYLPSDFAFPGKVTGSYALKQRGGKLSGNVGLSLPNSYFIVETELGDKQSFAYQDGVINARVDGNRINVDAFLAFKGRGDFRSRAQVLLREKGSPSINGNAEINIPNIYWAQSYVPYSRGLRGKVVGSVKFSGLVSKPSVTGQLTMSDGYLRLPQVGTELRNISLQIQANKANQAIISGAMNSGGGVIRANGRLSINDIKNWSAKMSLSGENIKFVDTHEATAFMTPNLQINADPKAVVITGTVDIPKADINLKDVPEFSIDESDDVIVIGEKVPGEAVKAVRVRPNILVRLGNEVFFKGFGFSTRLVGNVRVTNSRNTIVTNGSLNIVNGRYQAYGQDLRIANGRLVFNGLPKNVGVDVQAVRPVEDIGTVGIHLTGTIQKLKSTIFSDPSMQETDALSYLLTGQSLTSATGRETALLMQAVRGLGIDGSEGLIQRIGRSLGLDDLNIVTREDFRDSELQLGKRLGSKLYVRYLVGLFDSAHRLAVNYRVNKYLNFEVQAGADEQSVDLIYEYERD